MKKILTLFAFLAVLLPLMQAQETLTVSDGTSTSGSVPFCGYYHDYGFKTEILYTADMLEDMVGGTISTLTFYASNTDTRNWTATTTVRMEEVSASQLSTTAWTSTEAAVVVYSGPFTLSNQQLVIELATPFVYQGGNLIMSFYAPHGGVCGPSSTNFLGAAASNKAVYKTGNSTSFNDAAPESSVSMLPKCTFEYTAGGGNICRKPSDLAIGTVLTTSADFSWTPSESAQGYVISLKRGNTVVANTTTTNTEFSLDTLTAATNYTLEVRTWCGGEDTSRASAVSFRTLAALPASVPYTTGFEEGDDVAWEFANDATNKWFIGTAANNGGSNGLYISKDNGATNTYTSQSNNSYAYRSILVEEAGDYALSFDWRCYGEGSNGYYYDYMVVYLAPASAADPVAGSSSTTGWTPISDNLLNQETWTTFQTVIPSLQPGTYKLIFRWKDDSGVTNDPPAAVDNISFIKLTCPQPTALHFDTTATTTTSLTIAWTAGGDESAWVYRVNGTGEWTPISENPYTINDLTPGTLYNVELRAFCGEEDTSFSTTASFYTECAPITQNQIPYEVNFTSWGNGTLSHPCWDAWGSNSDPNINTTSGLYMYAGYSYDDWYDEEYWDSSYVILPEFDENVDLSTLEISFTAAMENEEYDSRLLVAAVDSLGIGANTTIDVIGIVPITSEEYNTYALPLTSYTGTNRYLMLLSMAPEGDGESYYLNTGIYIKDLSLHAAPSCDRADSISISDITSTTATLNIYDDEETNNYNVTLYAGETEIPMGIRTTATIELDELTPNTNYRVKVVSVCDDNSETAPIFISFQTECSPFEAEQLPYVENFDICEYYTQDVPCWRFLNAGNYPYISSSYNHTANGSKSLYWYGQNDNGTTFVLPDFETPVSELMFSAWIYKGSISNTIEVGYMTDATNASTFVPTDTLGEEIGTYTWSLVFSASFADAPEGARIAIRPINPTGYSTYIDDVTIDLAPNCPMPTGVSVNNITAHTANIVVNDANEEPNYTVLVYSGTDTVINRLPFTTTTIPVEGLHPDSLYNVSVIANCESGSYPAISTSFRTFCEGIDELPWNESFESYTTSNIFSAPCWSVMGAYQSYYSYPRIVTSTVFDGEKALNLYGTNQVVVLPFFETSVNELMLTLAQRSSSASYFVEVGVMTNPADTTTFRLAQACIPTAANTWETHSVTFSGMPAGAIAIRYKNTSSIYIDSIVVEELPACTRPNSVAVSNITTNSATLTIADANNIGNYVYMLYMNDTVFIDSLACQSEVSLTDLLSDTPYKVLVRTLCIDGPTPDYTIATFRTACTAQEFPFHFNPEDMLDVMSDGFSPCWSYTNFYRSTSNGVGYVYSYTAGSRFILPAVDADLSEVQFRTHVATGSTSGEYAFRVGVLEANDEVTWLDTIPVTRTASTTAGEEYIVLLSNYTGTGNRVVVGSINSKYIYFLDFHVEEPDVCTKVTDIVASDTTTSGITLSWTSDASQWVVYLDGEEVATVDQSTYTFQGLASSSTFTATIRALCGDDTARAVNYTFSTLCDVVTISETTSFSQNFDGITSGIPACWDNSEGTTTTNSYKWTSYESGHEGRGLRFDSYYNDSGKTNFLATPELAIEVPAQLAFWYKNPDGGDFSVFFSTDGGTTKTQIASGLTGASNWTLAEYTLPDTLVNQTINIYFKGTSNYGSNDANIYLDEVIVEKAPSCTAPTIALGEVTTTSAVITLSDANNVNHYQLYVDNEATGIEVTGTTYTIQDLSPASSHTVYAKTLCEGGDTTRASATLRFSTECDVIATLPWSENFDNATSGEMPACWDVFFNGSSASSAPHAGTSSYQTDLSGQWLYFAASNSSTSSYGNPQMAILPPFEAALNTLTMTFRYEYESASYGTLEVGYVTGADFNTDFVAVKTCTVNTDGTDDTVSFATAPAEAERIAFRWTNNYSTYYTAGVDNIVVDLNGDVPPVGIDEVEAADIVLYPNPATSNVTLRGVEAGSQVSVVDMNGRMVRDFKAANDNVRIDVSNLTKGAYFVRVVNGNTNAIRKLIVK